VSPARKVPPPGSARLFADSHAPAPPAGVYVANIDGASRGNPGPASYAVVLRDPEGKIALELAKNIGRETNNVAEYFALLAALDYAASHNIAALRVRSDSELLVRQMQGRYKVKSADLKPLHERASKLSRQLQYFAIEHVRRELNRDADALANVALDSAGVPKFEGRKSRIAEGIAPATARDSRPLAPPSAPVRPNPSRTIRARFVRGVFVPADRVDLPEGSEVSLDLRIPLKQ
jgi:ribonuclease HI